MVKRLQSAPISPSQELRNFASARGSLCLFAGGETNLQQVGVFREDDQTLKLGKAPKSEAAGAASA